MLVIERGPGEALDIGDDIRVVVLSTNGAQSRVGVIAPKSVAAHRTEIFERILKENGAVFRSPVPGKRAS